MSREGCASWFRDCGITFVCSNYFQRKHSFRLFRQLNSCRSVDIFWPHIAFSAWKLIELRSQTARYELFYNNLKHTSGMKNPLMSYVTYVSGEYGQLCCNKLLWSFSVIGLLNILFPKDIDKWIKAKFTRCNLPLGTLFARRLTHSCHSSQKRDIGKQCRPRSDTAEGGVWSVSTLFKFKTIQTSLLLIMDLSKKL